MDPADRSRTATEYDLIVIGAGCAGMSAALFAAIKGMKVLLLERTRFVGGTSALAAGAVWIPNTHLAAGSGDTPEKAANYLRLATRSASPEPLREAFLALGPRAVKCLDEKTAVKMRAFPYHPDYLSELPDSTTSGRVLECLPFDARRLGSDLALVRPPLPEFTVLGGMMVDRIDIGHLLNATRSWTSFSHAAGLLLRHAGDRLRHPRGARLVMGNALVARLLLSLRNRSVPIWREVEVTGLAMTARRVTGVELVRDGAKAALSARLGVVLAGGGFNDDAQMRSALIPATVRDSPRAPTATGDLQRQAIALGARLGHAGGSAAFWAPVSRRRRRDGSLAVFPHFVLDRAKPGTVVVDRHGRRIVNESTSYHRFGERMLEQAVEGNADADTDGNPNTDGNLNTDAKADAFVYLVADHRALLKYGLGMVRPGTRRFGRFIRDGYLAQAPTLAALAGRLGMDAATLQATVERMNLFAQTGIDADFQRGSTAYQRNLGDPAVQPNPTLGPIGTPPFSAIRLQVGDIAASAGLVTDADARVLADDELIPGLFAIGNEMQSVMGNAYPGPGINLGPAITFAYAAVEAAGRPAALSQPNQEVSR